MKKIFGCMLIIAAVAAVSVGCKPQGSGSEPSGDSKKTDKGEQLIIYTNSGGNGRAEWLQERASKDGYNIQVVSIQGSDLTNRLIAEKNNAQADVVFGLNTMEYEKLKKEELLQKYKPTWAGDVDLSLGDSDGYYYPIVVQPLVLMYNKDMKNPPTDWTDLADEQYKDKFTMLPLGGGTGKTIYGSILSRYLDDKGELGVSEEGWQIVKKIFANAYFHVDGDDNVGEVINGRRPMTAMWGSGVLQNQTERKYEFGVMSPKVGVPYVVEQAAIVSKTKKGKVAEDFINWFGGAQIQQEWSQKFGTIVASKTAHEKASQDIKKFTEKVHSQDIDWSVMAENIDKWVEKAELEFIR